MNRLCFQNRLELLCFEHFLFWYCVFWNLQKYYWKIQRLAFLIKYFHIYFMCVLRRLKTFSNDKKCKKMLFFAFFKKKFLGTNFGESSFHNDFASIKTKGVESWSRYSDNLRLIFQRSVTCCTITMNNLSCL